MKNFKDSQDVVRALRRRFSSIEDFEVTLTRTETKTGDVKDFSINGGFYKTSYNGRPDWTYFLHEVNAQIDDYPSLKDIYEYFERAMIEKIKWQKLFDEEYASEHGKKIVYKFDYSILDAQ